MAKVTREHRETACMFHYAGVPPTPLPGPWQKWIDTGSMPERGHLQSSIEHAEDLAVLVATAEERGAARERAAVVAWLRDVGKQYMDGDMVPCDEFTGEAYEQAAGEIETRRHLKPCAED